ncbi:AAA family ATPase [Allofournierella sp.]|uniref:AAA family ATPase n=1 Tax=Allofournierella sp. TaxID=1940256 RepID=UPI003AB2036F
MPFAMADLGRGQVLLAAPAGRASRRMAEICHHAASTLHSALRIVADDDTEYMTSAAPLTADFVIVDETSMLDQNLSSSLFSRRSSSSSILFVGGVDQLPPVGPGMVLRDLIESGAVPVTRLTAIFGQASGSHIPINCVSNGTPVLRPDIPERSLYSFSS